MKGKITVISLSTILLLSVASVVQCACSGEVDLTTVCDYVIDGDTFDTTSGDRIRLADIDAPESGEPGYYNAKSCLFDLVYGKTVYLDIDDIYQTDPYGRLVCVVYVEYSPSEFKNVNKALLDEGVAVISNYYNEFSPYSWSLICPKDSIPEFTSLILLPLFLLGTFLASVFFRRKSKV